MKLIWCSGLPEVYAQLEVCSVCPRYICIMLYVKLMLCSGLPWIYGQLEEGVGQSVMKIIWCSGLPEIHAQLRGGPSAKVGTFAKYEHTSKFTLASQRTFLRKTNKEHLLSTHMLSGTISTLLQHYHFSFGIRSVA